MDQGLSKSGQRIYCMSGLHLWIDENIRVKRNKQQYCLRCHDLTRERYKAVDTRGSNPTTGVAPWSSSVGGTHHYHPTKAESDRPMPPLVLRGPFGGPGVALGER